MVLGDICMAILNFSSPTHVSLLFFGGVIKEECQVPVLNELGVHEIYKTGQKRGHLKTKKGVKEVIIRGFGLKPNPDMETKKKGIYSTDEKILKQLAKKHKTDAGKTALLMLKLRELEKMLNTYYCSFEGLIYPDSCIRGSINHVSTDTGRTSSNRPNLQNLPRS